MLGRFLALRVTIAGVFFFAISIAGESGARPSNLEESCRPLMSSTVERDSVQSKLMGLWQCYKQYDGSKLPSCLYSIELFPDGTMVQKHFSDQPVEVECRYSINRKRINVKDVQTGQTWHFDFRVLKNGDLYLYKPPWHWSGWLTKDPTKVPKDHGCSALGIVVPGAQE
jgi:hypothetical protein